MPEQRRSKLWKESPSSLASAFWHFSCAEQSCAVVASAHNAIVVSCFILSKYYSSSYHYHQYPEHLADSVHTLGPALALHLHPSLSTLLERDGISQYFDLHHTFEYFALGSRITVFKTSL